MLAWLNSPANCVGPRSHRELLEMVKAQYSPFHHTTQIELLERLMEALIVTHEQLADRIARLDWSGTSLQHQLAVSAAVGALRGMSAPVEVADNVVHLKDFFERPENTVGSISVDNLL